MAGRTVTALAAILMIFTLSAAGLGSAVYIGGAGAPPNDHVALMSGGDVATATLQYDVAGVGTTTRLTLTLTNTSLARLGNDHSAGVAAPSGAVFSAPSVATDMQFPTFNGGSASSAGSDLLKGNFDAYVTGGPPGKPAPVIASIYDPYISEGPGQPTYPSPVAFVHRLSFCGCSAPQGITSDWFVNKDTLCNPVYIAVAKFTNGDNDVTDGSAVPEPASLMLLVAGLAGLGMGYRRTI